jgi:hypothetical protein
MRPEHRLPESSIVVQPEPMESATYTASSRLQAAAEVPLPTPPQPVVIADYGAATGHNSLKPMSAAIGVLRQRTRHDHAILVAHTDVPDNDFTALFRTLADDHDSYLHHDTASFPSAIGRSFYGQILPSNTVNLGWSSWAVQWLSRIPAGAPEFSDQRAGRIQQERGGPCRLRAPGRHGLERLRGVSGAGAVSRRAAGGADDGRRRERRIRLPSHERRAVRVTQRSGQQWPTASR